MTTPRLTWTVAPGPDAATAAQLADAGPGVGALESRLLFNRGLVDAEDARGFLTPDVSGLSDPFLLPEMKTAVDRLFRAIGNGEKIAVYGDFDVDGLSGTALLLHTLRDLGGLGVAHIPGRDGAGHGLDRDAISELAADGVSLIVTVDTGSTDTDEMGFAGSIGVDVVVTDHHIAPSRAAAATAVVNPYLGDGPGEGLTGSGVAFKLAQAMYSRSGGASGGSDGEGWPSHVIALAALGTVADVAPLTGENRIIVSAGLRALSTTRHAGLSALIARSNPNGGDLDTEALSFNVIPRLNAPGRLGGAGPSLNLLTASDPAEAMMLAQHVDELNTERRRLSKIAWDVATAELNGRDLPPVLVVSSPDFRIGILGPLAGRLCGEHGRPAVAIALGETHARASVRSTARVDAHAALEPVSDLMEQFGGHARAAGFTVRIDRLEEVLGALRDHAVAHAGPADAGTGLVADAEVRLRDLSPGLWEFVRRLGPFGEDNPAPVFITRGLSPARVRTMGAGGAHLRMVLEDGTSSRDAIGFGLGKAPLGGGRVDVAYALRTSTWRGRTRQELGLVDVRPSPG